MEELAKWLVEELQQKLKADFKELKFKIDETKYEQTKDKNFYLENHNFPFIIITSFGHVSIYFYPKEDYIAAALLGKSISAQIEIFEDGQEYKVLFRQFNNEIATIKNMHMNKEEVLSFIFDNIKKRLSI